GVPATHPPRQARALRTERPSACRPPGPVPQPAVRPAQPHPFREPIPCRGVFRRRLRGGAAPRGSARVSPVPRPRRVNATVPPMVEEMPLHDHVQLYLREMARTALLTAEEEVDLAKRYEAGLEAARLLAENPHTSRAR